MGEVKKYKTPIMTLVVLTAVIITVAALSGCIETDGDEKTTITIKGSSTVLPIATLCAEQFMEDNPDITVSVAGGGSSVGIRSVAEGEADIGDASREVKQSEIDEFGDIFYDNKVALDGVAVIVSKEIYDAGITDLTLEQIKEIFDGTISDWQDLGYNGSLEIFVNEREEGSGTRDTFMELVDLEETDADTAHSSNSLVKQAVQGSDQAIGYVGLGYVDDTTPAVDIDGVAANADNIKSETYPISRSLHMYTIGEPTGTVKEFIDYVLGTEGQQIVEDEGFIAII